MIRDPQQHFTADQHVAVHESIEGLGHDPFSRVLDGNDPEARRPAFHSGEYIADAGNRLERREPAEFQVRGLVAERSTGPHVGDRKSILERAGRGNDLSKYRGQPVVGERAGIALDEAAHDPLLARLFVHGRTSALLEAAHLEHPFRALIQLLENGSIHSVDSLAQAREFRTCIGSSGFGIRLFRLGHVVPVTTTDRRARATTERRAGAGVGVRKARGCQKPR